MSAWAMVPLLPPGTQSYQSAGRAVKYAGCESSHAQATHNVSLQGVCIHVPVMATVGPVVGSNVGVVLGSLLGVWVGRRVGAGVGALVGILLGSWLGTRVGAGVGAEVGGGVGI